MGGVFGCCDRQFDISSHLNRMGVFSLSSQRNFHADGIKCVSSVGVYMRDRHQKNLRTGKQIFGTFLGNPKNPPQYGRRDMLKNPLARKIVRREKILSRNFLPGEKSLHNIGGGEITTERSPPKQKSEYRYCSHFSGLIVWSRFLFGVGK